MTANLQNLIEPQKDKRKTQESQKNFYIYSKEHRIESDSEFNE